MGNFSRSLSITPNDTINTLPAWEFMNQTGSLGNNLRGSLIYVGGTAAASNVSVITAGTVGIQNRVVSLTLTNGGSGYAIPPANPQGTTYTSVVPTSIGPKVASGLTVNITVPVPTTNTLVPGTGYAPGAFTVTGGSGTGLSGTIDTITGGGATGPIGTFTILDGGINYAATDVLTIVDGAGINGSITLVTAPNGAVTLAPIAVGGEGYAVGDIITIVQAGSGGDATCTVDAVRSFSPVAGDAVVFNNVPVGTVLPVYVDYVTATGTTATLLVAGRESILD
tara:strand:+ start:50 stop:892 length:843 start_codon:yes stop_codon:yes gene_type:complete